jgi:predicted PurR-regulated permease PerM
MSLQPPSPQQSRILWFALTMLAVAVVVGLVAGTIWSLARILNLLSPVLWPLAIAAVIACLLSPVVDFFERRKLSRPRAILLVVGLSLAVVLGILASIIPPIIEETKDLVAKAPDYADRLQARVAQLIRQPPDFLRHVVHPAGEAAGAAGGAPQAVLNQATAWVTGSLPEIGSWLWNHLLKVFSGFGLLAGVALIPVYAFYFLLEQRRIESHWKDYLPLRNPRVREETFFVLDAISGYLVAFFRGQVLVAICDGVLYSVGFLIVGLNYALLVGAMAVALTIIPFLGAIVICVTALLLAFVQFGDWQHPALVLAVFAVVQTLESLVISPRIMGNRVGLHPMVIIIAVMTGTTLLGGILGGILAIPLAAALRVILFRYVWKRS